MKRVFTFQFVLVAILAVSPRAQLRIGNDITAPGGESASTSQKLHDTIGESFVGLVSNNALVHSAGFQFIVRDMLTRFPTAVLFGPLAARVVGRSVEVSWEVLQAEGLEGFRVYRAESDANAFTAVTDAMLLPGERSSFRDDTVAPGRTYYYRVSAVDADGVFLSPVLSVTTPAWHTELAQNYPNPFNPATKISFYLPQSSHVTLAVYDARGRLVRALARGPREQGTHEVVWDGTANGGAPVSSGVYFYRLHANGRTFARKMLMLK